MLAIPHYLVIGFFVGGAGYLGWRWGDTTFLGGSGLIAILVLIGAVILLFTGRFPRSAQDFALGMNRWVVRVGAYTALMTDQYPPFRLDTGGEDPAPAEESTSDSPPAGGSAGRITAVVLGVLLVIAGLGLAGGGGLAVWADRTQRDPAGYINTGSRGFVTSGQVLRFDNVDIHWAPQWMLGDVQIHARSGQEVFVGIAPARERLDPGSPPAQQSIWVASSAGAGARQLTWRVQQGQWTLAVLNADASPGVNVDLSVGATVPGLFGLGLGLLGAGVLAIAGGAWLQYLGLRRRRTPVDG